MDWTWQLLAGPDNRVVPDPEGVEQPAGGFPTQADAESWVGEVWRDLLAAGVDAVSLYEAGRFVYGPMSLHPSH